jgi:tetratricopeptide (TPR) repeat protein
MRRLGKLLLRERVITVQQLLEARRYESTNAVSLARALVALGYLAEGDISKALSRVYDLPTVVLEEFTIAAETIQLVPADLARKHRIFPVGVHQAILLVAVSDPTNPIVVEELHSATGHSIGMVLASESSIEKAINQHYGPSPSPSPSPLEDAVCRNPTNPEPWLRLGNDYGAAGEYELARVAFGQAARFGPNDGQSHWGLATSLLDLGRAAEAVAPAQKAVLLAPANRQARFALGRALAGNGRLHQAIEQFKEASRLSPDWPLPMIEQGLAHGRLGEHRQAAECLERALRIDPDKPRLWTLLGLSLCVIDDWKGAAHALETAVFARPDDGRPRALLGKAQRKLGQMKDAHESLAEAVRLGFDEPWTWYELGDAAHALGDLASLERAHEHLRTRDPRLARKLAKRLPGKRTAQMELRNPRPHANDSKEEK